MRFDEVDCHIIEVALAKLSSNEMKLLEAIFNSPGSMMTDKELKKRTGFRATSVGHLGKKLGRLCDVSDFGSYALSKTHMKVAYFQMIGPYCKNFGWVMNGNLRMALKSYLGNK